MMDMCYLACAYRTPSGLCGSTGGAATCPHRQKKKTNADRIRAMSDEELAELYANNVCGYCRIHDFCFAKGSQINCEDAWLDWLRQEAE